MVGEILRREREKQGLSIADVAGETSIRDVYLEAIEKGDYDALPGDVYAKGFIRNYSKFLQIAQYCQGGTASRYAEGR